MLKSNGGETKEEKHKVSLSLDEGQRPATYSAFVHDIVTWSLLSCHVYPREN